MQLGQTPPSPSLQDALSTTPPRELFAGGTINFDEIPGHASTQQAPPTPSAPRRYAATPAATVGLAPVDSSSSLSESLHPLIPAPRPSPASLAPSDNTSDTLGLFIDQQEPRQEAHVPKKERRGGVSAERQGPVARTQAGRTRESSSKSRRLVLERFSLYETKTKYYIVATNQADDRYRVLKVDRAVIPTAPQTPSSEEFEHDESSQDQLSIIEDTTIYSREEKDQLLETLAAGNLGGIQLVEKSFYGIAGFVRFTSTYYMVLIKKRAAVGLIGGHYVYHCESTVLRPVSPSSSGVSAEETRRITAFQNVDLNKYFYFSYTYDITNTLQKNLTRAKSAESDSLGEGVARQSRWNDKFVWNHKLLVPMLQHLKSESPWVLPMIYGSVEQAKISVFGRTIYLCLIARRSRHFAGARYRRRGVTYDGFVANDVESEQIVADALTTPFFVPNARSTGNPAKSPPQENRSPCPRYTSYVQVRGSIPVYWSQETGNYKPPIEIAPRDPFFAAAARHFDHLFELYGSPVIVFNLIRRKDGQESTLLAEFEQCLKYLAQFLPDKNQIRYIHYDIKAARKEKRDVIHVLEEHAQDAMEWTQFFHSGPEAPRRSKPLHPDLPERSRPLLQNGIVRTNCIDCVDRTNTVQFMIGKVALGHQLRALGIIDDPKIAADSDAYSLLAELWNNHGNAIALQYGGSHLVNTLNSYAERPLWSSQGRDKWQTVRRYYSNSFADADKQAAIDLFLGVQPALPPRPTFGAVRPCRRRSYRNWFTRSYLEPVVNADEIAGVLQNTIERDDCGSSDYWRFYYRPNLFTSLALHFAYTTQNSAKFKPARQAPHSRGTGSRALTLTESSTDDFSPFAARSIPHNPRLGAGPFRYLLQGVHGHKSAASQSTSTRPSQAFGNAPAEDRSPHGNAPRSTSTAGLATQNLRPLVRAEEAREYEAWIGQFDRLSLSQDTSEKDRLLYTSKIDLARSAGLGRDREISEKDRNFYTAVATYT
ncbi:SAC family polyphosphoinositide phosphatase [Sporobolomyces koalae]|uniref:SAC family polyphosphoinositide phosphatase n=1 Tax=Sporobolomyces koalae TaxID=500713 RepID=UPI003176626B